MTLAYNQVSATTVNNIMQRVTDNVFASKAMLVRAKAKAKKVRGGNQIQETIISSTSGVGGYYSGFDTLDNTPSDNLTSAVFAWKQLYETLAVSRLQMLQNDGKSKMIPLLVAKAKIMELKLAENLALGLFSDGTAGTGAGTTDQIGGFAAAISTSSTYGGIAVADLADWVAQSVANSGTARPLTINLMQQLYGACSIDSVQPTVLTATQAVYDQYFSIVQPSQRFINESMAKAGFKSIEFNGIPFIVDSHNTAGEILAINEEHVFLVVHPAEDMRIESFDQREDSNSMLKHIFWAGNLVCNRREALGRLDDVSVAS